MTSLCVPIFVTSLDQARRDIARAAEAGADMVELRIDTFTDPAQLRALVTNCILPCILTCRTSREGGHSDLPDEERITLLDDIASFGSTRYIDVELDSLRHSTHQPTVRFIASSHDFSTRPDRLYNILADLNASGADVNKIVWTPRSIRDNCEAFEILKARQKPTIALCMGEAGLISRVLAKKFGAFLTFASLDAPSATAPGQVSIADMKNLYRWDALNPDTKVYGVVAQPVMHSMSPAIHNAAFSAINYNGVYLPMLVEGSYESFKAFMETFLHCEGLHLSGLSVTLPHKENALRYLQEMAAEVEPLAHRIGAVNTLIIQGTTLRGMNTDYAAILDAITDKLAIQREDLARYRVAVLGAGGTGRTAVAALAHYGATVVVYNRTQERAEALAHEFNGRSGKVVSARIEKLCDSCCHIFINTTSVGMHPNVGVSPLGDNPPQFSPDTLVFDTIYNPLKTRLIEQAEAAGARTIGGIEMFVRQAAAQFQAWTGQSAPTTVMRRVIEQRLART